MAINKKLIHFDLFSDFSSKRLSANKENTKYTLGVDGAETSGSPYILWHSICWIKDAQKMWTHGKLYDCSAIPTKVSQLTNDSGYITSVAKGTATTQATAQTLMCDVNINGKTVTPVKFNGTVGSSTMPVYMAGGKPTPITSFGEANLSWGGKNYTGSYGPIDAALVDVLRANRFDGLPAECITVEYSRDGGATWVDYGATDKRKVDMVSQTADNANLYIGKNDTDNPVNANHKLRVIINTFTQGGTNRLYTELKKFIIYVGNASNFQTTCTIKKKSQSDYAAGNDVWTVVSENIPITGWSGYNVINTSVITTYGNQDNQSREIMFEFSIGNPPSSGRGFSILKIFAYGGVGWTTPSNMAAGGHLYSYDYQQNANFPSKVNAVGGLQENGTNLSSKYLGINAAAKSISDGTNSYTPSAIKTMEANLEDVISDVVSIDTSLFPTSTDEVIGFRQTNGGDGVGYSEAWLDRLKGNTVVWNQRLPYELNKWGGRSGSTITLENGVLTSKSSSPYLRTKWNIPVGNKFVFTADVCVNVSTYVVIYNYAQSTSYAAYNNLEANKNVTISGIFDCKDVGGICLIAGNQTDAISISRFSVVDLTQMFGAGNEPTTIEEFNARKPLGITDDYNEGELISTTADEIKSVGFNAWDEEWENGLIDEDTGTNISVSTNIRSKNKFKVLPNATYRYEASIAGYFYFYDRNEYYIGCVFVDNNVFTTPANARYARFYVGGAYGTTYNHDICIHLVHTGTRNGQYEPYKEYRLPLPIKDIKDKDGNQLFPNGLLSAGTAYDEITATKAIKRIGAVDMGALSWSTLPTSAKKYYLVSPVIPDMKGVPGTSSIANIVTSKYITIPYNSVYNENIGISIASANTAIRLYDTNYNVIDSPTTFKAAMSGVMLYYELAEPIEVDIEEWDRRYEVSDFGTEEVISDTPTTPLKADIIYEYNAKGRIEANERGIEELNDKIAEMNEYSITSDKVWSEDTPVDCTIGEVDNDAFLPDGIASVGGKSRISRMYVKFSTTDNSYSGEMVSEYSDNCLIIGVKGYYELTAPNGTMLKRGYLGDSSVKVEQTGNIGYIFNFTALDMEEGMNVRVGAILEYIDIN